MKGFIGWLDGKKTAIGATLGVALSWCQGTHLLNDAAALALASVLSIWTGAAVMHKMSKGDLTN